MSPPFSLHRTLYSGAFWQPAYLLLPADVYLYLKGVMVVQLGIELVLCLHAFPLLFPAKLLGRHLTHRPLS